MESLNLTIAYIVKEIQWFRHKTWGEDILLIGTPIPQSARNYVGSWEKQ